MDKPLKVCRNNHQHQVDMIWILRKAKDRLSEDNEFYRKMLSFFFQNLEGTIGTINGYCHRALLAYRFVAEIGRIGRCYTSNNQQIWWYELTSTKLQFDAIGLFLRGAVNINYKQTIKVHDAIVDIRPKIIENVLLSWWIFCWNYFSWINSVNMFFKTNIQLFHSKTKLQFLNRPPVIKPTIWDDQDCIDQISR